MAIREYQVGFNKADGSQYHTRSFKTYGAARRYIRRYWSTWVFREGHGYTGWFITRSTCIPKPWQLCGVIIAQSKDAIAKNYYVHKG